MAQAPPPKVKLADLPDSLRRLIDDYVAAIKLGKAPSESVQTKILKACTEHSLDHTAVLSSVQEMVDDMD